MIYLNTNGWSTCEILPVYLSISFSRIFFYLSHILSLFLSLTFSLSLSQFLLLKNIKLINLGLQVCGTLFGNLSLRDTADPMVGNLSTGFASPWLENCCPAHCNTLATDLLLIALHLSISTKWTFCILEFETLGLCCSLLKNVPYFSTTMNLIPDNNIHILLS